MQRQQHRRTLQRGIGVDIWIMLRTIHGGIDGGAEQGLEPPVRKYSAPSGQMTGGILRPGQRGRRMVRQASHRQAFGRLRGIVCMVGILGATMDGNKMDGHGNGHVQMIGDRTQMSLMKSRYRLRR